MSKSRKITLSVLALGIGLMVCLRLSDNDLGTSVVNKGNKSYYQDENGELWESKKDYENYEKDSSYIAPDGTHWKNEYRYQDSQG